MVNIKTTNKKNIKEIQKIEGHRETTKNKKNYQKTSKQLKTFQKQDIPKPKNNKNQFVLKSKTPPTKNYQKH